MTYDYRAALYDRIKHAILDYEDDIAWCDDYDEAKEMLYDKIRTYNNVTGNLVGSYTCSSYRAEQNLEGNYDLLEKAIDEFEVPYNEAFNDSEYADVLIREYLFDDAFENVLRHDVEVQVYIDTIIREAHEDEDEEEEIESNNRKPITKAKRSGKKSVSSAKKSVKRQPAKKSSKPKKIINGKSAKGQRTAAKRTVRR